MIKVPLLFCKSVVSAKSEPDTIVVENAFWMSGNAEFTIVEKKLGAKTCKIVMSDQGK